MHQRITAIHTHTHTFASQLLGSNRFFSMNHLYSTEFDGVFFSSLCLCQHTSFHLTLDNLKVLKQQKEERGYYSLGGKKQKS